MPTLKQDYVDLSQEQEKKHNIIYIAVECSDLQNIVIVMNTCHSS